MTKSKDLPARFTTGFMRGVDGRTELGLRLYECFESIVEDSGGLGAIPQTKLLLIERATFQSEICRALERSIVEAPAEHVDLLGKLAAATNTLIGLARTLGLERADVRTLDLKAYVETQTAKPKRRRRKRGDA